MRSLAPSVFLLITLGCGCMRAEPEFQFEIGDVVSPESIQRERIPVDLEITLEDAAAIIDVLLSRQDIVNSGPILHITTTSDYDSELGSVVVWMGIVRGELDGEGLLIYFRKVAGVWTISHEGAWIS